MENHHFYRENSLEIAIFNGYFDTKVRHSSKYQLPKRARSCMMPLEETFDWLRPQIPVVPCLSLEKLCSNEFFFLELRGSNIATEKPQSMIFILYGLLSTFVCTDVPWISHGSVWTAGRVYVEDCEARCEAVLEAYCEAWRLSGKEILNWHLTSW